MRGGEQGHDTNGRSRQCWQVAVSCCRPDITGSRRQGMHSIYLSWEESEEKNGMQGQCREVEGGMGTSG